MPKRPLQSAEQIIAGDDGQLSDLIRHAKLLRHLTAILKQHLDPALAGHACVANLSSDMLILMADSPAWATRLRYQSVTVLTELSRHLSDPPRQVRVIVRPREARPEHDSATVPVMSSLSADILRNMAQALPDENLARALLRLARRSNC